MTPWLESGVMNRLKIVPQFDFLLQVGGFSFQFVFQLFDLRIRIVQYWRF